jgi:hypothetical protein
MTIETNIFNWIGVDLSPYVILFRNNQGVAKFEAGHGKFRYVRYGVGPHNAKTKRNGGSDGIGWTSKTITPDMVGQKVAIFTAIETKTLEGNATEEQINFCEQVRMAGGYAGFATNREEARAIVNL